MADPEVAGPCYVTLETREEKVSINDFMMIMMMMIYDDDDDDDDKCSDIPQLDQSLWVRPLHQRPLLRSRRRPPHFAGKYFQQIFLRSNIFSTF